MYILESEDLKSLNSAKIVFSYSRPCIQKIIKNGKGAFRVILMRHVGRWYPMGRCDNNIFVNSYFPLNFLKMLRSKF